jgi:hypothetical protein
MLRKIDAVVGWQPSAFEYGNTFDRETIGSTPRLRIGLDDAQDGCVYELAGDLAGPFQLLYLLHTTRTDAALGRYESPELDFRQVLEFARRFGPFLAQDARHDFWLRSHDDDATIVLDRHNVIFAYGPLPMFEAVLTRIGISRSGLPVVPDPHVHYYHQEWDRSEREILDALAWTRKPLRRIDLQVQQ